MSAPPHALIKIEQGYMLKRDPDNGNKKPIGMDAALPPRRPVREMWAELAMVKTPTILVRGLQSDRYPPEVVVRLTREYPQIHQETVESQHDVMRDRGEKYVSPLGIPQYMPNAGAAAVAMKHGLRGQTYGIVSACSSGAPPR